MHGVARGIGLEGARCRARALSRARALLSAPSGPEPCASLPRIKGHGVRSTLPSTPPGSQFKHRPSVHRVPVFRLFFHPRAPVLSAVTQTGTRQSAYNPRIIVPRDLLSLRPDSPDSLALVGGESLNIPQGGSQPWRMTASRPAIFCHIPINPSRQTPTTITSNAGKALV